MPPTPTKEGFVFDAWYNGDTAFDFTSAITADITLKAKWLKACTVTFETNGGNTVSPRKVASGKKLSRPSAPTKATVDATAYSFTGWFTDSACTKNYDFETPVTADITLYAKWNEVAVYSITINETENGTATASKTSDIEEGETVTLTITPKSGDSSTDYSVESVSVKNGENDVALSADLSFVMPAGNVTVIVNITKKSYIGSKKPSVAKAVGDIVFNDGSATPYTEELTLTDAQKTAAIAVIYKADGTKSYGVGIKHSSKMENGWCLSSAKIKNYDIPEIQCTVKKGGSGDSYGNYKITGNTDGSDNFAKIKAALGDDDDTDDLSKYPAFEFAINYKDKEGSHVKETFYEDGWYLPAVAELFDIWKEKVTVDAALEKCDGDKFDDKNCYWSSNQYPQWGSVDWVRYFFFSQGGIDSRRMSYEFIYVCCIRVFN